MPTLYCALAHCRHNLFIGVFIALHGRDLSSALRRANLHAPTSNGREAPLPYNAERRKAMSSDRLKVEPTPKHQPSSLPDRY